MILESTAYRPRLQSYGMTRTIASLVWWYLRSFGPRLDYDAYLSSPAWQLRRRVMLWQAGHRCQMNANHTYRLEVHHNTYARLGRERLFFRPDLTVLCRGCHALHHGKHNENT